MVEEIEKLIKNNKVKDEYGWCYDFSDETIRTFEVAIGLLKKAQIYAHRIDWLVSSDDSQETFHERLKEELNI